MSENLVEKSFLYLLLFSVAVHAALIVLLLNLPEEKKAALSEPLMVDLEGIQALPSPKETVPPVQRHAEVRQRVAREFAPLGDAVTERLPPLPIARDASPATVTPKSEVRAQPTPELPGLQKFPRDELFRKSGSVQTPDIATLYPGAANMARLEESYRKKYSPEVADGKTRFLDTDDIRFGSFLRRFETAVYGVWRYPAEAAKMGVEGISPVKITFNQRGEIIGTELLQSSGSKILDSEVLRTLKQIGPVGSFPKGYEKETFSLIAFFHYGITQGAMRSLH